MNGIADTKTPDHRLIRRAGSGWLGVGADREWHGDRYDGTYCFLDPDTKDVVGTVEKMDNLGGGILYYEVLGERQWGRYFDTLRDAESYFRNQHNT